MAVSEKIYMEYRSLLSRIDLLQKEISTFPEGELACRKNGEYMKFFRLQGDKTIYLCKKERQLASDLALKKLKEMQLGGLLKEKEEISRLIKLEQKNQHEIDTILNKDSRYCSLLQKRLDQEFMSSEQVLCKWVSEEYQKSTQHPEHLIYKTMAGVMVRSKSEVIIANALFTNKIPFRYEAALPIGEIIYYPDFTIKHPVTEEIFYFEHFGMIDKAEYLSRSMRKIEDYISVGIIPTQNLICTFETSANPLDSNYIQRIIELYFY